MGSLVGRVVIEQRKEIADLVRRRIGKNIDYYHGFPTSKPGLPMGNPQAAADELYLRFGEKALELSDDQLLDYLTGKVNS